jgi:hypothetical protein
MCGLVPVAVNVTVTTEDPLGRADCQCCINGRANGQQRLGRHSPPEPACYTNVDTYCIMRQRAGPVNKCTIHGRNLYNYAISINLACAASGLFLSLMPLVVAASSGYPTSSMGPVSNGVRSFCRWISSSI